MKRFTGKRCIMAVAAVYAAVSILPNGSELQTSEPHSRRSGLIAPGITAYAAEAIAYQQSEGDWSSHPFNHRSADNPAISVETDNTIAESGCSIMSLCNSIAYKTGNLPSVIAFADYAGDNGFRPAGSSGVTTPFFRCVAEQYGSEYGFSYDGSTSDADEALSHIRNGGTACYNIYNHWIAVVDYDSASDMYLVLDSARRSPSRSGYILNHADTKCERRSDGSWTGVAWVKGSFLKSPRGKGTYGLYYSAQLFSYSRKAKGGILASLVKSGLEKAAALQSTQSIAGITRTIKLKTPSMMSGDDVRLLQTSLTLLGFPCNPDGVYGPLSATSLKSWQGSSSLAADAIFGPRSKAEMARQLQSMRNQSAPVTHDTDEYFAAAQSEPVLRYVNGGAMPRGDAVKYVQTVLNKLGANLNVDGIYGPQCRAACIKAQCYAGLHGDGIVGKNTWQLLKSIDGRYGEAAANRYRAVRIGAGAAPSVADLRLSSDKRYYCSQESISFDFDTDTASAFRLMLYDGDGNLVKDYVTNSISTSVGLDPGYYTAKLVVSNESGSLESERLEFVVFDQIPVPEGAFQLISSAYNRAVSFNPETNILSAETDNDCEKYWYIHTNEDLTFSIHSLLSPNYKLAVENGKLSVMTGTDGDETVWYLCSFNGKSIFKNKMSDDALAISSDGIVSVEPLDDASVAQDITLYVPDRTVIAPEITQTDNRHADVRWNAVAGADSYMIVVYDFSSGDADCIYQIYEVTDTMCTVELPESDHYSIWLEAYHEGGVLVNMGCSEDEPDAAGTFVPDEADCTSDYYWDLAHQLQNYLLTATDYSPSVVADLDINFDGRIDAQDLTTLKRMTFE